MSGIQPIRDFVRVLAGKRVRGVPFSQHDEETLSGYVAAFPDLANPILVQCTVDTHKSWGALVFADEMVDGASVGNIMFNQTGPTCAQCGDGRNIALERVIVIGGDARPG